MFDSNIKAYRYSFTGTNCKYCKYYKLVSPRAPIVPDYYKCILRDKIIHFPCKAKLCKYYTVEEK